MTQVLLLAPPYFRDGDRLLEMMAGVSVALLIPAGCLLLVMRAVLPCFNRGVMRIREPPQLLAMAVCYVACVPAVVAGGGPGLVFDSWTVTLGLTLGLSVAGAALFIEFAVLRMGAWRCLASLSAAIIGAIALSISAIVGVGWLASS